MRFHPWVFSGAIYRMEGSPAEGDLVDVYTSERQFIARGHYQIGSITVRVLSFAEEAIDQRWWNARIRAAYRMREAWPKTRKRPVTGSYTAKGIRCRGWSWTFTAVRRSSNATA